MGKWIPICVGEVHGRMTVLGDAPPRISGGPTRMVYAQCSCGELRHVAIGALRAGTIKSCGCLSRDAAHSRKKCFDGQMFGMWKVLHDDTECTPKNRSRYLVCECQCPAHTIQSIALGRLTTGIYTHCKSCKPRKPRTHGLTMTGMKKPCEYAVWATMLSRCRNPKMPSYAVYGARGIRVCQEWQDSFEQFLADMGHRPGPEFSLERLDNDGPYSPANVVWATRAQQALNKRTTVMVDFRCEKIPLITLADRVGGSRVKIYNRIHNYGWSVERAVSDSILMKVT